MVGPAQAGMVAACVVLFVPMGLAGWHLSRNKVLFFSGALFITLAVFVHLTPHFPSLSHLLLSSLTDSNFNPNSNKNHESSVFLSSSTCLSFLHDIIWSSSSSWSWSKSNPTTLSCGFQTLTQKDANDLLNGSWILVAGDSQARLFSVSLLSLILNPIDFDSVKPDLFKRHSDYHVFVPDHGITVDFLWAPFEINITDRLHWLRRNSHLPEVIVAGDGLWHMLHVNDASDYAAGLVGALRSAELLLSPAAIAVQQPPHLFWLGMPALVNSKLNTEEKRARMNESTIQAYEREVRKSRLLRKTGGPFLLLDIWALSQGCGSGCTEDGMHYNHIVYDAALHVMLNALLIESQQRI